MRSHPRQLAIVLGLVGALWIGGDRTDGYSYYQLGGVNVVWTGAQSVRYLSPSTFPEGSVTETNWRQRLAPSTAAASYSSACGTMSKSPSRSARYKFFLVLLAGNLSYIAALYGI